MTPARTAASSSQPGALSPVTLEGASVRLEPMAIDHVDALARVGLEPDLWRWTAVLIDSPEAMHRYVRDALGERDRGVALPFVIVDRASGQVIGSTRYGNVDLAHRRLEIGWTWLTSAHQRTRANSECKLLLLTYAFEALRVNRVELRTDLLNEKSRNAIMRIGATQEGIARSHIVTHSGRIRDTVYFSIIASEWPAVRAKLEGMLEGQRRTQ
jgi:RimJ/RimL family protein N-acetyltransferase